MPSVSSHRVRLGVAEVEIGLEYDCTCMEECV